jgi:hypothetical protein
MVKAVLCIWIDPALAFTLSHEVLGTKNCKKKNTVDIPTWFDMFVKSFFFPQISIEPKKNIQKFISDYNTQKANG